MFVQAVNERTSAVYSATLTDQDGAVVPAATLETLTLSLVDVATGRVINSRNAQNVLNANGVTVDVNGLLTWTMTPADNVIDVDEDDVIQNPSTQSHYAIFKGTWNSGTRGFTHIVEIDVMNLPTIT